MATIYETEPKHARKLREGRGNGVGTGGNDRRDRIVGIVALLSILALFALAIVLATIYGQPAELEPIDFWMMP